MRITKTRPAGDPNNAHKIQLRRVDCIEFSFLDDDDVLRRVSFDADTCRRMAYLLEQGAYMLEGKIIEQDNDKYVIEEPDAVK